MGIFIVPALCFFIGMIFVFSSQAFEDDRPALITGVCIVIFAIVAFILRTISPMCYDGSLFGEALIRACG